MKTLWTPTKASQGLFKLRYNPAVSLMDRPELSVEIPAGKRWERIALEDPPDRTGLVDKLLDRMRQKTQQIHTVLAELRNQTVSWPGQHAGRILVILDLDPPPNPTSAETVSSP